MIAPPDDEEILEPAGDEQLVVLQEAQVTRAQERSLSAVGQASAERPPGLFRTAPIARRDTRAGNPNLSDAIWRTDAARLGFDDEDFEPGGRLAAAHDGDSGRVVRGRIVGTMLLNTIFAQHQYR